MQVQKKPLIDGNHRRKINLKKELTKKKDIKAKEKIKKRLSH